MKDFGYYKNIINQNYNPEKKALTKEKFYELQNGIFGGNKKSEDELFELTCFFVYDHLAHAYSEGIIHGDFEEDLQIAALKLYRMKIGEIKTRFKNNYFADITRGTSFKDFTQTILQSVAQDLYKNHKETENQPINRRQSDVINQIIQNPEDVAVTKMDRKQISRILAQSGNGKHSDTAMRNSIWLLKRIMMGYTTNEIACEEAVTRQAVSYAIKKSIKGIHKDPEKMEELTTILR